MVSFSSKTVRGMIGENIKEMALIVMGYLKLPNSSSSSHLQAIFMVMFIQFNTIETRHLDHYNLPKKRYRLAWKVRKFRKKTSGGEDKLLLNGSFLLPDEYQIHRQDKPAKFFLNNPFPFTEVQAVIQTATWRSAAVY